MRWFALLALVVLAAFGCGGSDTQEPEVTGTIAFTRGDDVWLMRVDGSRQRRLTRGNDPSWSPDGRRIALSVYGNESSQIWVIDANGRDLRRLTMAEQMYDTHFSPAWSPDGKTIAFQGYNDGNYWINVVGANGSGQRELSVKGGPYADADAAWSRDGQTIMFTSVGNAVSAMRPDGSGRRVVARVDGEVDTNGLVWSPDRRRFTAFVGGDLWVLSADGTRLAMLFDDPVDKPERWSGIAWSPDGEKIAFSVREGRGPSAEADTEIYVVDSDGSELRKLTDNDEVLDNLAAWSPDGRAIAFTTNRDGQSEIYLMDTDGSDQRNMSQSPLDDLSPVWSTAPKLNERGRSPLAVASCATSRLVQLARLQLPLLDPQVAREVAVVRARLKLAAWTLIGHGVAPFGRTVFGKLTRPRTVTASRGNL